MLIIGDRAQKMDEEGEGFLSVLKRYVTKGGNLSSFPGASVCVGTGLMIVVFLSHSRSFIFP